MTKKPAIKQITACDFSPVTLFVGDRKINTSVPVYSPQEAWALVDMINKYFEIKKRYKSKVMSKVTLYFLPASLEPITQPNASLPKAIKMGEKI